MRFVTIISTIILAFGFGLLFLFAYWQFNSYKPIIFNNIPFPVSKKQVRNGETLSYIVDYCKKIGLESFVTREFIDQIVYVTPGLFSNVPIGCNKVTAEIVIPDTLENGMYRIQIHYSYQVNPIRMVSVIALTQSFEVIGHMEK